MQLEAILCVLIFSCVEKEGSYIPPTVMQFSAASHESLQCIIHVIRNAVGDKRCINVRCETFQRQFQNIMYTHIKTQRDKSQKRNLKFSKMQLKWYLHEMLPQIHNAYPYL